MKTVAALSARNQVLENLLRSIQWCIRSYDEMGNRRSEDEDECPVCAQERSEGHDGECLLEIELNGCINWTSATQVISTLVGLNQRLLQRDAGLHQWSNQLVKEVAKLEWGGSDWAEGEPAPNDTCPCCHELRHPNPSGVGKHRPDCLFAKDNVVFAITEAHKQNLLTDKTRLQEMFYAFAEQLDQSEDLLREFGAEPHESMRGFIARRESEHKELATLLARSQRKNATMLSLLRHREHLAKDGECPPEPVAPLVDAKPHVIWCGDCSFYDDEAFACHNSCGLKGVVVSLNYCSFAVPKAKAQVQS